MLSFLLLTSGLACVAGDNIDVKTSIGVFRGHGSDGVSTFLGIPYAQAPIGSNRFAPPVPAHFESGLRPATVPPAKCVQGGGKVGSEDCLYLNAFAPTASSGELRPVIVNIHGGGFVEGSASQRANLTRATNAVVFSIQYRLGIFGFFSPTLPPPNFGMQDQRLALRWVQENAKAFGGNPDRVMIYGCSAGGASVAGHLVLPDSFGLYSSASIASPGGHQGWMGDEKRSNDDWMSPILNEKHSQEIVTNLSCSRSSVGLTLSCLRNASVESLFAFEEKLRFAPALPIEGQYPLGMIQRGDCNHVPTMIGGASCESCASAVGYIGISPSVTKDVFDQGLIKYGLSGENGSGVGPETLEKWYSHRINSEGRWRSFARILGDSGHSCSTSLHAEALAKSRTATQHIWRYLFDIRSKALPGATHCSESAYLMHTATTDSSTEKRLEDSLSQWMVNLAQHGDPNTGSLNTFQWTPYTRDHAMTLIVTSSGVAMNTTEDTIRDECANWKPYLGWGDDVTLAVHQADNVV